MLFFFRFEALFKQEQCLRMVKIQIAWKKNKTKNKKMNKKKRKKHLNQTLKVEHRKLYVWPKQILSIQAFCTSFVSVK